MPKIYTEMCCYCAVMLLVQNSSWTFVWLFSTVRCQMSPQIACISACIITLVAFVRLFSTVYFQMFPQRTYTRGYIITLITFFGLFLHRLTTRCHWTISIMEAHFFVSEYFAKALIHHQFTTIYFVSY